MSTVRGLAAATLATGAGLAAGAVLAARKISAPHRPALTFAMSPYELGIEVEEVGFVASDGVQLAGWWLDNPGSERVVVIAHGHRGSRADMLGIGPGLWRAGNTVLLFDFRGNGDSGDGPQSLAHYEQRDLAAAVELALARRPDAEICLVGYSMGAATSILVAAADPRVAKVVADSPFADMRGVVSAAATAMRLPPVPLVGLVDHATRLLYGYRFAEVQPVDVVAAIAPRPLLVVHGTKDSVIPVEHARRLAAAAGAGSELWIVEGVDHCGAYFVDRPGYVARVAEFLAAR